MCVPPASACPTLPSLSILTLILLYCQQVLLGCLPDFVPVFTSFLFQSFDLNRFDFLSLRFSFCGFQCRLVFASQCYMVIKLESCKQSFNSLHIFLPTGYIFILLHNSELLGFRCGEIFSPPSHSRGRRGSRSNILHVKS